MDSSALLDCALLQLTPTRTRCDLVVVCGGKNEKMASGLVEPFVSHLKFARDQIFKGGYSITLRPPFPRASWFTKNTFQRFVRFVSTPEILERASRIEQEIFQIENSVQSNELPHTNITGNNGALEEPSKFHLQRVLEARKAILQKEQAMAYACAIVAGFEMDIMVNLICFANAFGASRLREACEDFKELYKKKHTDGQWMEELAAMKASSLQDNTSGVILAYENNGSSQSDGLSFQGNGVPVGSAVSNGSSDAPSDLTAAPPNADNTRGNNMAASVQMTLTPEKVQFQMPWTNQIPQYMYISQNQQIPPYPVYPLPNAHSLPPFYPGHPFWPRTTDKHTNVYDQEFNNHRYHKSAQKKEKPSYASGPETLKDDEQTEPSDRDSGDEEDAVRTQDRKYSSRNKHHVKKQNKSSKTVVIRNINYITSKRRNGEKHGTSDDSPSVETVSLDEVSIRREMDEAVASFATHEDFKGLNIKNSLHQGLDSQNGTNGYADQDLTYELAGKISKGEEKNENWSAFQSLLRSHEESTSNGVQNEIFQDEQLVIHKSDNELSMRASNAVDLGSKKDKMQNLTPDDSILLTCSNIGGECALDSVDFANGETVKGRDYQDMPLISKNLEESSGNSLADPSEFVSSTIIGNRTKVEDCFIVDHAGYVKSDAERIINESYDTTSSRGDSFATETNKSAASIDDSFMVQSSPEADDHYDSQWRTDIRTVVDWTLAENENGDANVGGSKLEISRINEPDDLCVVLVRDDQSKPTGTSWTPEMDYGIDMDVAEIDKSSSAIEPKSPIEAKLPVNDESTNTKTNAGPTLRASIKDARSKILQGSPAKGKKTHPTSRLDIKKSKLEKEEELRKRMEEIVIQRQKRIAERTAAGGLTLAASQRVPGGCKPVASKVEKHSPRYMLDETKILSSSKAGAKIRRKTPRHSFVEAPGRIANFDGVRETRLNLISIVNAQITLLYTEKCMRVDSAP